MAGNRIRFEFDCEWQTKTWRAQHDLMNTLTLTLTQRHSRSGIGLNYLLANKIKNLTL